MAVKFRAAAFNVENLFDRLDVGLLSKMPIQSVWSHVDDRNAAGKTIFSRDCPEYRGRLKDGRDLWILCNHLKSTGYGSQEANDNRRKQQATQIAKLLEWYDLSRDLVIVAGDLNDTPDSNPLKPLTSLSNLYDVLELQYPNHPEHRWTYHYNSNQQIDYMLVSKPLANGLQNADVWRRGIHNVERYTTKNETPYPKVTNKDNSASDHGCVYADFSI